jgi:tetratricopeptide (TPR) repeat protein
MKHKNTIIFFSAVIGGLWTAQLAAQEISELFHLQERWAEVNYQLEGKTQLSAFAQLVEEAEKLSANEPSSADVWIWSGIIKSTYAGAKGGLGALSLAKEAKADLERAMEIDADALDGSSYTSLGTLYHSVPGWPVGFGNDGKAEELLRKALTLNPKGIDTNYFYGTYLLDEKRYDDAEKYLLQAQQAPVRPNRPVADSGRQREIAQALELLNRKR